MIDEGNHNVIKYKKMESNDAQVYLNSNDLNMYFNNLDKNKLNELHSIDFNKLIIIFLKLKFIMKKLI